MKFKHTQGNCRLTDFGGSRTICNPKFPQRKPRPKYELLINIAKTKGKITIEDAAVIYKTREHRMEAIEMLVREGVLKLRKDSFQVWEYIDS